jgi:hypothetical protein
MGRGLFRSEMARAGYFGADLGWISIEIWALKASATCCGVNLAVAGFGFGFCVLFQNGTSGLLRNGSEMDFC